MASARTIRPSASGLSTSTFRPLYMVTTSPGREAEPEIMFSAIGRYPVTASLGLGAATASRTEATAAAPAMSPFISHMPLAGFTAYPPVSNVMPLPIRARCWTAPRGAYASRTSRGGAVEPIPTARIPPYPPRLSAFSSRTSTESPAAVPAAATASAKSGGRSSLGAVLTQSRVRATAPTTVGDRVDSAFTASSLSRLVAERRRFPTSSSPVAVRRVALSRGGARERRGPVVFRLVLPAARRGAGLLGRVPVGQAERRYALAHACLPS